jgi:hypothetical protein
MSRTGIGIRTAVERSERITGQIHVYDGMGKGSLRRLWEWFCAPLV